jgi:hypothetical protein
MSNISVIQFPNTYPPAYNDSYFVVDSINKGQANFKYIADIIVNGQSFRQAVYPHPTYNYGVFNVGRIVESYLNSELTKDEGFKQNIGSMVSYSVSFGEEYGLASSGTTVYAGQLNGGTYYTWNGVLDNLQYNAANGSEYLMGVSNVVQFLTNSPSSGVIRSDEDAWLSSMSGSAGALYYAKIETWGANGNLIQTVRVLNPFQDIASLNSRHVRFGCGTNNLNDIASSGIVTGSQPIITDSVVRYSVVFETLAGLKRTNTKWFIVNNECTRNTTYRFHWLNRLGGWDSFTFIRGHRTSETIERKNYKSNPKEMQSPTLYGTTAKSFYNKDYNIKYKTTTKVSSDWINEETNVWLAELVKSPIVYLDDATYGLIAVNILNSGYDYKTDEQDRLFNLEIEFKYTFDNNSQRL